MIWSLFFASLAGLLSSGIFIFLFTTVIRQRLWTLEVDLADLQDRHLRTVRRDAAKSRWDAEDQLDLKIEQFAKPGAQPKGWTKWGSSNQSRNSENP